MNKVKKKVLFVIDTLEFGGTEQSLFETVIRFSKLEPVVCQIYRGSKLKPQFETNGIKVYTLNIASTYGFRAAYKRLEEVVQLEKPDILVGYLTRSELVTRFLGKYHDIPVVGTFVSDLYDASYNSSLPWKSKIAVQLFKLANRFTARYCCGFISNSEGVKHSNANHLKIPLNKIKVIYRGRDSKKFLPKNGTGNSTGEVRFLNIGRLVPVKGQLVLIEAFERLSKVYSEVKLDIVGDGPLMKQLKVEVAERGLEGKVVLHGARGDVPAIIHNYDCFVFPSYSEGFSGSVVESMLAGLPVLASKIPANQEAVKHLQTGYLFEVGSVDATLKAMHWYIENKDQALRFASSAQKFALENFELTSVSHEVEEYLLSKIR